MIPHEEIRQKLDRSWTFRLIDTIRNSQSGDDLEEVCKTIAGLDDPRSIEPLIEMLEDRDLPYHIREAAGEVLQHGCIARCEADRRGWWNSGDKLLMKHALLEARTSEADIIIPIAQDPQHEFHRDAIAGIEFGFEEPEYKQLLIKALEHENAEIRGIAARNLCWDEPVLAEDGLIKLLNDPDDEVASDALDTLRWFSSQKSFLSMVALQNSVRDSMREDLQSAITDQKEWFEAAFERLPREHQPFLLTWLKPIEELLSFRKENEEVNATDERVVTPKHPPREKTVLCTAQEVISLFDDADGCWNNKQRWRIECKWNEFTQFDMERMSVYFREHQDHHIREFGCCALASWDRNDVLEIFLHDACSGVKRNAAYHLKRTSPSKAVAQTLFNVYQHINSTGELAADLLAAFVVHAPRAGLEDLLVDIALNERRIARKRTAVQELIKMEAHSSVESLLSLLEEPPLLNWGLHKTLVEYCVEQELAVPYFSELCKADDLYLQEWLAKAVPYLKPVLLKGVSYAAKN